MGWFLYKLFKILDFFVNPLYNYINLFLFLGLGVVPRGCTPRSRQEILPFVGSCFFRARAK
jgi:hypothetical protein